MGITDEIAAYFRAERNEEEGKKEVKGKKRETKKQIDSQIQRRR